MLAVEWDKFAIYLYTVKKLDRGNEVTDRSRFRNIERYFIDREYNEQEVHGFFNYLERDRHLMPSSLNNYLKLLKHINRFLKIEPDFLREFSMFHAVLPEVEVLTQEEKDKIISLAYKKQYRYGVLLETIYSLALRVNEACSLKWVDVRTNYIVIQDPKSGYPQRMPVLPDLLAKIHKIKRVSEYVFGPKKNKGIQQGRIHRDTVGDLVKKCAHEAGITKRTYTHLLRHTAIDTHAKIVKNAFITQKFARHKRIDTTARYVHTDEDALRESLEQMTPESSSFDSLVGRFIAFYEHEKQAPHFISIDKRPNYICIVARRPNYTPLDILQN